MSILVVNFMANAFGRESDLELGVIEIETHQAVPCLSGPLH